MLLFSIIPVVEMVIKSGAYKGDDSKDRDDVYCPLHVKFHSYHMRFVSFTMLYTFLNNDLDEATGRTV